MASARRRNAARGGDGSSGGFRGRSYEKLAPEVDAFSERDFAQKLMAQVRIINRYAVIRAYLLKAIKMVGSLALLWSTVVLLGGFVGALTAKDFWYLTIIVFMQAAGVFNVTGDSQFGDFNKWIFSIIPIPKRSSAPFWSIIVRRLAVYIISIPLGALISYPPLVSSSLSLFRLRSQSQDYGSDDSEGKLKAPALRIFYFLSLVQGGLLILFIDLQGYFYLYMIISIRLLHGSAKKVIHKYSNETELRCVKDPMSANKSWNLITYGAGLLDSESPEDYVSGARALNMLIDQEITKRWLIRSPRHRIQKLIDALGWRSPVDRETRGLSARIVAHLVADLNLSQFQGALECISSLLDISYHNTVDQEVLHLLSGSNRTRKNGNMQDNKKQVENGKPSSSIGTNEDLILQGLRILEKLAQNEHNCTQIYDTKGLLLKITAPFNCKEFTEDIRTSVPWLKVVEASLRVVARLMEAPGDTGVNVREQIARNSQTIDNLNEVLSLQVQGNDSSILELQTQATEVLAKLFSDESTTNIIFQKEKVESTNMSRGRIGTFTAAVLDTLLTDTWMEDYLTKVFDETMSRLVKDEQGPSTWEKLCHKLCPCLLEKKNKKRIKPFVDRKMKEAQETAIRHKEMACQALAKLSIGNKNIFEVIKKVKECPSGKKEVTECGGVVHSLIEMIDRKIETTIECSIEALKTKINIKTKTIRCRISAAEFLKNLCAHSMVNETFKKTMLRKILEELLCTNRKIESQAGGRSLRNCFRTTSIDKENPQAGGRSLRNCFRTTSNDEENPQAGGRSLRNCFRTTSNDEENQGRTGKFEGPVRNYKLDPSTIVSPASAQ